MENEYLHILLNLFAVVVLIFVCIYVLRRLKFPKAVNKQGINILHVMPLGSKEKILLVEVNRSLLLLGATANHIETLYVFDQNEAEQRSAKSESAFAPFANALEGAQKIKQPVS